jgi:hypothetical protein
LRYICNCGWLDNGEALQCAFGGIAVDEAIGTDLLKAVQSAAVPAAVKASEEESHRQDEVLEALRRDLEAVRYSAQRAQRQFDAADPENRLVVDELEYRWNQALERVREIELRITAHTRGHAATDQPSQQEFEELAKNLEAVWCDPGADVRLKKRIVRTLIEEVVVDVDAAAGEII